MYQLKSKQTSRRHDRGRDSSSQQQAQPQAAYPPQAATAAGAQSQSQGLSQSIPTPVTSSTPTPGQHPDAYAELLNPALQQSPTNRSLGASFDQSRTPTAAATGSSMTSGLNATMLMASNVQAVSASMPLLKKASLKPSVAVKLGYVRARIARSVHCCTGVRRALATRHLLLSYSSPQQTTPVEAFFSHNCGECAGKSTRSCSSRSARSRSSTRTSTLRWTCTTCAAPSCATPVRRTSLHFTLTFTHESTVAHSTQVTSAVSAYSVCLVGENSDL